jgi:hypothetical protein
MPASTTKLAPNRWRLPYARLKRVGVMAVVAVCKLAILLAMLESAGHTLESNCETCELATTEVAALAVRPIVATRVAIAEQLAVRCLGRTSSGARIDDRIVSRRTDGHRLPNGLCAPMQC